MITKTIINLLSIFFLSMLLLGCDKQVTAPKDKMNVVAITVPGTPWHDGWLIMQKRLTNQHNDILKPTFYITSQLGSEESTLSQLRRGRVHVGGFSLQGASSVVPELGILLAPYLFDSHQEIDFVMDNYISKAFGSMFEKQGLVLLSWAEVGWTSIYGKKPILNPEDAQGKKLRSSNAVASQLLVRAIGADMVPLPFPDIMPSLQTGLIDGAESGSIFYALGGVSKEAPHLTLTKHAFDTGVFLANKSWFDSLSNDQKKALKKSLPSLKDLRVMVRDAERKVLENANKNGITINHLDTKQREKWKQATAKNHQKLIQKIDGNAQKIYNLLLNGKEAFKQLQ